MKTTLVDLKARRSIRSYTTERVKDEDLDAILEAGTYAASGMGRQSAVLVAIRNQGVIDTLERLNAAVLQDPKAKPFYGASTLVAVLVDKTRAATPKEDGALVMGNLLNAAHALGIGSCWIHRAKEVFESAEGRDLLKQWGIDDSAYMGIGFVVLGYSTEAPEAAPRREGYIMRVS